MPVCLPGSVQFPDTSGIVYVSGWGTQAEVMCTTGEYGPDPYTKCTIPFKYEKLLAGSCFKYEKLLAGSCIKVQGEYSQNFLS